VTADCRTPQRRARPSPTPRHPGPTRSATPRPTQRPASAPTPAASHAAQRSAPNDAAKPVPFTEAPMPEWMWSEGVDVPPAAPDCGACAPDPQSPAQGEGASDPAHRTKIDSRPPVVSLPAEHLSRQPGCPGSTRRSPACVR
jgi:hypothetical protein